MPSAARHLLFLVESKQKQIPRGVHPEAEQQIPRFARNDKRGARDDIVGAFFISLLI